MAEFKLPENSVVQTGKSYPSTSGSKDVVTINVYRYDPEDVSNPRIDTFIIDPEDVEGVMVLDYLMYIKDYIDQSFSFRKSCREGVCGSCAMNINGKNSLACTTNMNSLKGSTITIYPLPSMYVIRDLVVDLSNAFEQYKSIKPWMQRSKNADKENLQSPNQRSQLNGLWECILCFCCTTSCPSYWWNGAKRQSGYLGPATLLQAYRWINDSRDEEYNERLDKLKDPYSMYRCQTILNCTAACPKGLNPGKAIAKIKAKMITKSNE